MNLIELIPFGKENAVPRKKLCTITGMSDRLIRKKISRLRREYVIINDQSGRGYYRSNDKDEIERFVKQEEKRLKSIGWSLKGARKALKVVS